MAEAKTKPTAASAATFIKRVPDEARRQDCRTLVRMMKQVTKAKPTMWGPRMVGFGRYHYVYATGHEGDCFLTGFGIRKDGLTVYIMSGFTGHKSLMAKLGKHRTGKSCLYISRLEDVNLPALEALIAKSVKHVKKMYA